MAGLAGLQGAGAVDAVLANQHDASGKHIEGEGQLAARRAHLELQPFQLLYSFAQNVHSFTLEG
jgi:hypothetical protein